MVKEQRIADSIERLGKDIKIQTRNLDGFFGMIQALKGVSLDVYSNEILGAIGPANSGKTTFLRCLNRMNDLQASFRVEGRVLLDGKNIYDPGMDVPLLRKRVGVVFSTPNPLPMSVFENIAYGPRRLRMGKRSLLEEIVEKSLRKAALWEEVKDRLKDSALKLSGGQQQRLCLARALAVEPEVILYDEPCSGLDPISTAKIEETMFELQKGYTQILVTNNTKQAARVSERTAFFLMGELVEIGSTDKIFTAPEDQRTEDYVTGRFG